MLSYFGSEAFWAPTILSIVVILAGSFAVNKEYFVKKHWARVAGTIVDHHHSGGETDYDVLKISYHYLGKDFHVTYSDYGTKTWFRCGEIEIFVDPRDPTDIHIGKNVNYYKIFTLATFVFLVTSLMALYRDAKGM
ncbi:DUF3592 domain-containing protein [Methylorubrum sp. SB2]|uniref:DUF3592 domain-containing protein n=1 Tax=Methylorubrum subtropicum TaxID=3138812 RepID=UPI00313DA575